MGSKALQRLIGKTTDPRRRSPVREGHVGSRWILAVFRLGDPGMLENRALAASRRDESFVSRTPAAYTCRRSVLPRQEVCDEILDVGGTGGIGPRADGGRLPRGNPDGSPAPWAGGFLCIGDGKPAKPLEAGSHFPTRLRLLPPRVWRSCCSRTPRR